MNVEFHDLPFPCSATVAEAEVLLEIPLPDRRGSMAGIDASALRQLHFLEENRESFSANVGPNPSSRDRQLPFPLLRRQKPREKRDHNCLYIYSLGHVDILD